jgi:nitroreductase
MKLTINSFSAFSEKLFTRFLSLFGKGLDCDLERQYFHEMCYYWMLTRQYNASNHTDEDKQKMQFTILRENHVIEKGMSMQHPRKGFGQEKVKNLIGRLNDYYRAYGQEDLDFLAYPFSTIQAYFRYSKENGMEYPELEKAYEELKAKAPSVRPAAFEAGILSTTRKQLLETCDNGFESLLRSRHSLRYFSDKPVEKELIVKALQLAQRTPSACNRQGWHTHVFSGDESVRLMYWQEGCRGCEDGFRQSILVTANLKAFLSHEVFQAYIDGGLYAMNLVNALHSLGLGTIPLSCGFSFEKLKYLDQFGIPDYELPILIIAFGNVEEEYHYAVSSRKDISQTNTFHY